MKSTRMSSTRSSTSAKVNEGATMVILPSCSMLLRNF